MIDEIATLELVDTQRALAKAIVGLALVKGDQGPPGDEGPQGIPGVQGPKGDQGEVGPRGFPGPKGDKGDDGGLGPEGPEGKVGPKGVKGDRGSMGPEGPRGIQGLQGPPGSPGRWGGRAAGGGSSSSGSALAVSDEGVALSAAATSFDFTGTGVTATAVGNAITVTVAGGGTTNVYVQDADPGAVGAGKLWVDTTDFPTPPVVRFRSTDDDAWFDLLEQYRSLSTMELETLNALLWLRRYSADGSVIRTELVLDNPGGDMRLRAMDEVGTLIAEWEVSTDGLGALVNDELGTPRVILESAAGDSGDTDARYELLIRNAASADKARLRLDETGIELEAVDISIDIAGDAGSSGDVLTADGAGFAAWVAPAASGLTQPQVMARAMGC